MYQMCDVKKPIITLVLMMLCMLPWPLCGKGFHLENIQTPPRDLLSNKPKPSTFILLLTNFS